MAGHKHGSGTMRSLHGGERLSLWKDGEFVRWLSTPSDEGSDTPIGSCEVPISTPRPSLRPPQHAPWSSPNKALTPRRSPKESSSNVGEVFPLDVGEGDQVLVERCTLGLCQLDDLQVI